ncbi:MAG: hypothetical protein DWP98_07555 [Bacteroidetes bacterium]|nr:MAG: hypothetical protein DWP98_07555 [Bacteroidota bacterium]MBL1144526.1 hypothetical protein [Bacteroidota bacterium]NOG57321.1 hypothetical protein [Bacteroidota bacterium]
MPTEISKLSQEDRDILLRAPAIVAILAAISDDGDVSEHEKSEAIKLAHFRTYTSEPILHNFYKEADLVFEKNFEYVMSNLPESWEDKKIYLESRIVCINEILPKMSKVYSKALVASLKSFSRHVFKSNSSFLESFILPIFSNKIKNEGFDINIGN